MDEEIQSQIRDLASFQTGSKEKSAAIEDLAELYKLRIEEVKAEMDLDDKIDARDNEDRYINLGIAAAGIVLPLIFNCVWMSKGFKFEESGTYTSTTFRNLFRTLGWNIVNGWVELWLSSQLTEDEEPCVVVSFHKEPHYDFEGK